MAATGPLDRALLLLGRRGHSEEEIRRKLRARKFDDAEVEKVIALLREKRYLDDGAFASAFAEAAVRNGRGVGARLVYDLRRRGIPREMAETAAEAAVVETDQETLAREILRRRFPGFDARTADEKEKRRVLGYLQRRGFTSAAVLKLLREDPEETFNPTKQGKK